MCLDNLHSSAYSQKKVEFSNILQSTRASVPKKEGWSDMDAFFTEEEMRAWVPFIISVLHLLAVLDAELKEAFDLSHLDYGILMLLNQTPERRQRMSDLASAFGVDPSNITYRIRRMEARGLVERCADNTDGRVVEAQLTNDGLILVRKAQIVHVQGARQHFLNHIEPQQLEVIANVFGTLLSIQQSPPAHSTEKSTSSHSENIRVQ